MGSTKLSTRQILENNLARSAPGGMDSLKILLHDLRSMHNVGAAFRCADAFGVPELLMSGFTPTPPRPEITKTAIGAEKHVPWRRVDDAVKLLDELREEGYLVIGVEQTEQSILLPDLELPREPKICLVFGNEVTGISEELIPRIGQFVEIPQYGHKHSLNVSVAVGVTLYGFLQKFWNPRG